MKNYKRCINFSARLAVLTFLIVSGAVSANTLESIRVWPSPDETRIVIDSSDESHYSYFTLTNPDRLVLDIPSSQNKASLPIKVNKSPVLKRVRKSTPKDKLSTRLVFDLSRSTQAEIFKLDPTPNGEYGYRLVVDLAHPKSNKNSKSSSQSQEKSQVQASNSKTVVARDASQYVGRGDVIVAIDAGHGGEDPGSIGPHGRYEKTVTLAIAKKLAAQLNSVSGVKAVLTRSGDYFVPLNKRSEIARNNKAHLLVSIHADAFSSPQPRGASVFVLNTRRANTEISKWVEDHERQSQLLGGAGQVLAKNNSDPNISQTLLDLQFSHSQKEGYKLARDILSEMGKVAYLHKKEPVNASLAVLKSPDIPSVLVETGFISNPKEEKLLFQASHQNNLARSMKKAIVQYFEDTPPEGTLFAARKMTTKHIVKSGESLSLIAKRYGTSVGNLLELNKLKSTRLNVGQVLLVSGGGIAVTSASPAAKSITHVVKPGEFLGKIATQYGVSVADIRRANNLSSSVLKVGQKLKISSTTSLKPVERHYKVKRGDFLGKIARSFDVSIAELRQHNNLTTDTLTVGQELTIPAK